MTTLPLPPLYTVAGDVHTYTWEDGYRIEIASPVVQGVRLYGELSVRKGAGLLNVVDGSLLDDTTRKNCAVACNALNGAVEWGPRLLYATSAINTLVRGTTETAAALWEQRETLADFLAATVTLPEGLARDLVFPGGITSIAAPSGVGKSVVALMLAYELARGGLFRGQALDLARILFLDTDNPRSLLQYRLRQICAQHKVSLDVMSRDKTPKLLDTKAWNALPAEQFDVIMLDSFGAAAPGVSEKEGAKLQQVLDTVRRVADRGPAVILLDNTTKSALTYRGRGEKTERVDAFYEARDITHWAPDDPENWVLSLPTGDDADWQARALRRKGQTQIRIAFVCRKMRWGEEPDPFAVQVDFATMPWSLADITDEIVEIGKVAKAEAGQQHLQRLKDAATALVGFMATMPPCNPFSKGDAVTFLTERGLKRGEARNLLNSYDANQFPEEGLWRLVPIPGTARTMGVFPLGQHEVGG